MLKLNFNPDFNKLLPKIVLAILLIVATAFIFSLWLQRTPSESIEIYFSSQPPREITVNEPLSFSFVIKNNSNNSEYFDYNIFSKSTLFDKGTVLVNGNGKRELNKTVFIAEEHTDEKVTIDAWKSDESEFVYSLWFWVNSRKIA